MAFIKTTAPQTAEGPVRAMYERQQSFYGFVPNYAKVFGQRPEVLARWGRLLAEIRRPMEDRLFELVTLAAALELKNTACSLAHGKELARFCGEAAVMELAMGERPDDLSDADLAAIRYAQKIIRNASGIGQDDVDEMREHGYSDNDIFDIAASVAGRSFFTRLLDALGVETDGNVKSYDESFRKALAVGRPVSEQPVEMLPE